jgi:hypothetical protein
MGVGTEYKLDMLIWIKEWNIPPMELPQRLRGSSIIVQLSAY